MADANTYEYTYTMFQTPASFNRMASSTAISSKGQEIVNQIDDSFDVIVAAQGTTTTSCGLALGLNEDQKLMVVPALKGFDVKGEMESLLILTILSNQDSSTIRLFYIHGQC